MDIQVAYYQLSKFHTQKEIINHQKAYHNFLTQSGTKITLRFKQPPSFKGFDPMNAESINDSTILHHTFLKLSGTGDDRLFINSGKAITLINDKIWFINKVILYAYENDIQITNNSLEINVDGKNVSWSGAIEKKTEDEIIFSCDD